MQGLKRPIADIKVGQRYRTILGDLTELAASMEQLGLLQPIVLSPDLTLVAGQRRLEAAKLLGWTEVSTVTIACLEDAVSALRAEQDENTCRLPFNDRDANRLYRALLEMEKPKARERQLAGLKRGSKPAGQPRSAESAEREPKPDKSKGETRKRMAHAVTGAPGGHVRMDKVQELEETAADAAAAKEERERAEAALLDIEHNNASTDGAYKWAKAPREQAAKAEEAKADKVQKYLLGDTPREDVEFLIRFQDAIKAGERLTRIDVDRLVRTMSDSHMAALEHHADAIRAYVRRVRLARKGDDKANPEPADHNNPFSVINGGNA